MTKELEAQMFAEDLFIVRSTSDNDQAKLSRLAATIQRRFFQLEVD